MTISNANARIIIRAIYSAIQNEEELIRCYMGRRGKSIDAAMTRKTRYFITRMIAVRKQLSEQLQNRRRAKKEAP